MLKSDTCHLPSLTTFLTACSALASNGLLCQLYFPYMVAPWICFLHKMIPLLLLSPYSHNCSFFLLLCSFSQRPEEVQLQHWLPTPGVWPGIIFQKSLCLGDAGLIATRELRGQYSEFLGYFIMNTLTYTFKKISGSISTSRNLKVYSKKELGLPLRVSLLHQSLFSQMPSFFDGWVVGLVGLALPWRFDVFQPPHNTFPCLVSCQTGAWYWSFQGRAIFLSSQFFLLLKSQSIPSSPWRASQCTCLPVSIPTPLPISLKPVIFVSPLVLAAFLWIHWMPSNLSSLSMHPSSLITPPPPQNIVFSHVPQRPLPLLPLIC